MASLAELAGSHTDLDEPAIDHLQRLVGAWALLADLSFADLLLYAPSVGREDEFVVLAHARGTTGPTVHIVDPVGDVVGPVSGPLLRDALKVGAKGGGTVVRSDYPIGAADSTVEEEIGPLSSDRLLRVDYVPVRQGPRVIGVLTRQSSPTPIGVSNPLEQIYRELYDRFTEMIVDGTFPYEAFERIGEFREPRVGDGVMALNQEGRIEYASPNAISALHRLGVLGGVLGRRLSDLGLDDTVVRRSFGRRRSTVSELEHGPDLTVVVRAYPLVAGDRATGAVALLRDISELRHRDRLLCRRTRRFGRSTIESRTTCKR